MHYRFIVYFSGSLCNSSNASGSSDPKRAVGTVRPSGLLFRNASCTFHFHFFLLAFFLCFFVLFQSCCSHTHKCCHIFYSHTEYIFALQKYQWFWKQSAGSESLGYWWMGVKGHNTLYCYLGAIKSHLECTNSFLSYLWASRISLRY